MPCQTHTLKHTQVSPCISPHDRPLGRPGRSLMIFVKQQWEDISLKNNFQFFFNFIERKTFRIICCLIFHIFYYIMICSILWCVYFTYRIFFYRFFFCFHVEFKNITSDSVLETDKHTHTSDLAFHVAVNSTRQTLEKWKPRKKVDCLIVLILTSYW